MLPILVTSAQNLNLQAANHATHHARHAFHLRYQQVLTNAYFVIPLAKT